MSRVIKFRAWDKPANDWLETELKFYGFHLFGECTLLCPPSMVSLCNVEIDQFTGMQDKNGIDVYEGDLIELHGNKNGCVQVCFINAYVGGWVLSEALENHISLGARAPSDIEVIGNIHENPELLEAKP